MSRCLMLLAALLLSGCASYGGSGLVVGQSVEGDVMQRMGEPAMQWTNEDGSRLLAYPRGSGGHTFMVQIGRDGKLGHIENVLSSAGFSRIRAGMNMDQVLRTLGPPNPAWTVYFKARDELVWEWRYCDDWNEPARFNVLFENSTGLVRSTQSYTEGMLRRFREVCSR